MCFADKPCLLQGSASLTHDLPDTNTGRQLDKVAKLMKLRDLTQNERDAFVINVGGFDTHNTFESFGTQFGEMDEALRAFR